METVRQKRVARLIQEELGNIFQREGLQFINNAMLTISRVYITPDLLIARIYISIFRSEKPDEIMQLILEKKSELQGILGNNLRNQLRRIPNLEFYLDESLDNVFRLEELFKKLRKDPDS